MSTFTWVQNSDGDFNTAANWRDQNNNPGVPGPNDDAVINQSNLNITSSTSNSVNSILCSSTLTITNGTFSVADGTVNSFISMLNLNAGSTLQANAIASPGSAGTLFIGGGSAAGTLVANSNARITFTNNPHEFDLNAGSSMVGSGTFTVGGGVVVLNVSESAPANFEVDSGVLRGPGTFTITNSFLWSGGSLDGLGTTVVPANTTLSVIGNQFNKFLTGGYTLNIAGTATWTGTGELDGSAGSTINNSGVFNVQSDTVSGDGGTGGGMAFNNTGIFIKSGTTGTTTFQGNPFHNSGTVSLQGGTLNCTSYTQTGGATIVSAGTTLASSGTVALQGGTLSGAGTVNADVSNSATVGTDPGIGTLTISRSYTQTASGTLNLKVGGATQFDSLAIGGAANLGGTLNIFPVNGFTPSTGQSFKILTFASATGDFATKNGFALGGNLFYNPVIDPTDYTLLASAPSPGILQLGAATFSANVTSGAATITVVRNSGSQGSVSINYATSNGTAQAGVSYTATSGTLTFGPGVISQSFTIPILPGAGGKGNQTVNITLSAPTGGATLGGLGNAVLTLVDNTVQAGQLQFSATAYSAPVTSGGAVITVTRANGSQGTVTVQYATSDGTAQGGVRYTPTSGTLTFANGVTSQSFTIPLLNPFSVHGNQTVNITLSSPGGGAALGAATSAVLTIVDNNPIVSDDALFLAGLYHDILGRASDAAGLANFLQTVDAGRNQALLQFATSFVTGAENRTNFVSAAYTKYLGRTASGPEVAGWVAALQQGMTQEQITVDFVSSPEYFQRQGGTNSSWLDHLYQDLLGRARDPGSQGFLTQLTNGAPLGIVATQIINSQEYKTRLITQVYTTYLQRTPGPSDLAAWLPVVGQLPAAPGQATGDDVFLAGVIGSPEYYQTIGNNQLAWTSSLYTKLLGRSPTQAELTNLLVSVLNAFQGPRLLAASAIANSPEAEGNAVASYYQQFLGRTASAAEVSGWVNQLVNGLTREQVIAAFVSSPEYMQKHPGNSGLVDQLYIDLLGRQRSAGETGFVTALNNGTATPQQVAAAIMHSTEYAQRLVNQFYTTALGRLGTTTETSGWVQALLQGMRDEQVFSMIIASGEYFQRAHPYP